MSDLDLPARLKAATRAQHRALERSNLVRALLRGALPEAHYAALLRNLSAIYEALERHLVTHRDAPTIAPIFEPALFRSDALRRDLGALSEGATFEGRPLGAATLGYVRRLDDIAAGDTARLVGHAYVRYLGDLHGGQRIARAVRQAFVRGEAAQAFYDFGDEVTVAARIDAFRRGLTRIGRIVPEAVESITNEAVEAFDRHDALFAELGPSRAA